jgi:hypothetical protein
MRTLIHGSRSKHTTILGIALAALLALPMGCVGSDDGTTDPDTESEATQDLSLSFLASCDPRLSTFSEGIDTATMRVFVSSAVGINCKKNSGPPNPRSTWSGRCFNDLSNRNGVLTCAGG